MNQEFLLIRTRGPCSPDVLEQVDSVRSIEKDRYSEKPEEFRRIIDAMYPRGKRIELFARKKAPGWDAWGNEDVLTAESELTHETGATA